MYCPGAVSDLYIEGCLLLILSNALLIVLDVSHPLHLGISTGNNSLLPANSSINGRPYTRLPDAPRYTRRLVVQWKAYLLSPQRLCLSIDGHLPCGPTVSFLRCPGPQPHIWEAVTLYSHNHFIAVPNGLIFTVTHNLVTMSTCQEPHV